ncbi:MATE family efflux transporter [Mailhella massiliensis]|uniref:MATE family efflux transporter n=1 Tax=Mailhella massiliensis TaxID=1903261 RepID=UPI00194F4FDC|nr:MATE family efflux transporter [Mailhella massiliensis]
MGHSQHMDMLHGPLMGKLILFALPIAFSSILQQLFISANVAVVGHFVSAQAMAAVGGNGPIVNLIINLFLGLSVGANVVIARYVGREDEEGCQSAVHTVMAVSILSGLFLLVAGQVLAPFMLKLVDVPEDVMDLAVLYLRIYFLGMPCIMVYNFGAAVLRSVGDTKRPMYSLIAAGIVNVTLSLVLVLVFNMGVAGVGLATLAGNVVSSGLVVYFLLNEDDLIRLSLRKLSIARVHLVRVIKIGAPAGLQGMIFSLSNVCILSGINGFGSSTAAGSATAINFEFISYFFINAFCQATVTFTSQNYAMCRLSRCRKIFREAMTCGILLSGATCLIFTLGAAWFTGFYTSDPEVIRHSVTRVSIVESMQWLSATYEISGAALRGMGISMLPAIVTLVGSCILRIVWVYSVFRMVPTYEMLLSVYPVSWAITGLIMLVAYFLIRKKLFSERSEGGYCKPLDF